MAELKTVTVTVTDTDGTVIFVGGPLRPHDYVDIHQREGEVTTMTCAVTAQAAGLRRG